MAKIVILSGDFPPHSKGTGKSAYRLAKYLKLKYNHEISIITGDRMHSFDISPVREILLPFFKKDYVEIGSKWKIYRMQVPKIPLFQNLIHSIKISKYLRFEKPDYIFIVSPAIYYSPKNIPYSIKNGGCNYIAKISNNSLDSPYQFYFKLFYFLIYFLEKRLFQKAEKIISVSKFESLVVSKYYNIENGKSIHSPNGIEKMEENPPILSRKGIKSILFVGSLTELKGSKILINAFREISQNHIDLTFNIVGDGPLYHFTLKYIKENNLTRISCRGYLPSKEIVKYYRQADLIIIPSLYDGCPNVLLEAFGFNIPVIGSNVGGIKELIVSEKTGVLIKPGISSEIVNAVNYLLQNEGIYENIKSNILKKKKEMTWFERIDIFNKIIEENK
ncbi:glycosyltransferase family 4 protein [Candidatus Lokiarchaeum ossiferum]|uniref:glycosyltransferase family 4 protein n=1 Tax=Candidatus Lokiarchaeum ossiferum TaxID=2951803 RepID=UPI00352D7004